MGIPCNNLVFSAIHDSCRNNSYRTESSISLCGQYSASVWDLANFPFSEVFSFGLVLLDQTARDYRFIPKLLLRVLHLKSSFHCSFSEN